MNVSMNRWLDKPDLGKLLLRVSFGAMMLFHGVHKLLYGINSIIGMVVHHGMPSFVAYGVFVGEIIVPLMFIFGILVRPAALIFCATMLFAWLITQPGIIFTLTKVGGWGLEEIAVYFFAGLAIALLGCGRYSIMKNPNWR
ncbi:putative oxidoreductase [Gibbsiella quercinecans]|uniref:GntR family transcriptional regulator n=2 Tax=Gibbsiella quercinecans TaxID=929813 RepID=A0A250B6M2_9GAMM|nr:DoxX family protein [Gibbsiella quercinecans]ATA21745.1 GntR family transcriptional regulator [Gibbsiella quercinecans]RLM03781.1 GntR family transcriptional regulator [Gibbsiella quercinecans]TCT89014.1 putative oxidoreductase [Gibbsiella quercinecans]